MSTIKISQLYPVGSELFQDAESFLTELDDGELDITGGAVQSASISISITIYPYPSLPSIPFTPPITPSRSVHPVFTIEPVA